MRGCVGAIQHDAESVELVRMYVDRSLRRQGAGRRLFEHLLAHARGLGARSITLTTPSANTVGLAFTLARLQTRPHLLRGRGGARARRSSSRSSCVL